MEEFQLSVRSILELSETCRYTAAYSSYSQLQSRLQDPSIDEEVRRLLGDQLHQNADIQLMITRAREVQQTLEETANASNEGTESGWIHGVTMFGITTYYRHCENNEITVKMEGTQSDLPIFEQLAVIHEVDLYKDWVPFCRESINIGKRGKAELFPYIYVGMPPITRDWLMQAYGADCLQEEGKIILLGKSIDELTSLPTAATSASTAATASSTVAVEPPQLKEEQQQEKKMHVPWKTEGWTHSRLVVKEFKAVIEILSPESAKSTIIAHADLRASLPKSVINFAIKNLAGYMLYFLQKQVKKVVENHDCEHVWRIRADPDFYRDWLLPKVRSYCDLRGWEQPVIGVLGEDGIPPVTTTTATTYRATATVVEEHGIASAGDSERIDGGGEKQCAADTAIKVNSSSGSNSSSGAVATDDEISQEETDEQLNAVPG